LGKDNIRVVCVPLPNKEVKILHVFVKKKQKTPQKELTLDDYLRQQLKNPKFKKEWEKSEAPYQITRELIAARIEKKISQRSLAKKAKTTQAVISRIENMSVSPSVNLLQKIAEALKKKLEVKFT